MALIRAPALSTCLLLTETKPGRLGIIVVAAAKGHWGHPFLKAISTHFIIWVFNHHWNVFFWLDFRFFCKSGASYRFEERHVCLFVAPVSGFKKPQIWPCWDSEILIDIHALWLHPRQENRPLKTTLQKLLGIGQEDGRGRSQGHRPTGSFYQNRVQWSFLPNRQSTAVYKTVELLLPFSSLIHQDEDCGFDSVLHPLNTFIRFQPCSMKRTKLGNTKHDY